MGGLNYMSEILKGKIETERLILSDAVLEECSDPGVH